MTDDDHSLAGNVTSLTGLAREKLTDVPSVVARLDRISRVAAALRPLGEDDGMACFARLYLQITRDVLKAYDDRSLFRCGDFVIELDIAFAQRYLDAIHSHGTAGEKAPACWEILFDRRQEAGIDPWRFAATGVNAHVNFDLAFALLDVWEKFPDAPFGTTDAQYDDYRAINTIFERNMDSLCQKFDAPWSDVGGHDSHLRQGGQRPRRPARRRHPRPRLDLRRAHVAQPGRARLPLGPPGDAGQGRDGLREGAHLSRP